MAEVIWTDPALSDLDAVADYIAIENPDAARALVQRVFARVEELEQHPKLGPVPGELEGSRYRHLVESLCRIIYRYAENSLFVLHVMRFEQLLKEENLGRGPDGR